MTTGRGAAPPPRAEKKTDGADSVPLGGCRRRGGWKAFVALFAVFFFVVSDVFQVSVLSAFRGALKGWGPTPYGVVIQATCLVVLYSFALYLIEEGLV